ncbi:ABC transporter substrate-binding protein [Patescibacteria group bacterium]|nr:ABC transporter substrate-binding protein [Patescibacteria group bacterium]
MKKFIWLLAVIIIYTGVWWLFGHPGFQFIQTSPDKTAPAINKTTSVTAGKYADKKVLYIDSYHEGYAWSDGVTRGVRSVIDPSGAQFKIMRMDTKQNPEENFKKEAALKIKAEIESFQPDVLIVSDDNAFSYIVKEYYRDAGLPVVFSGLNWDAGVYGAPYKNTTGMVEVSLTNQIIDQLKVFTKGSRLGYISANNETERKNLLYYGSLLGIKFDKSYFVNNFAEWKQKFKILQGEVDLVIFENNAGIADWNDVEAQAFALAETKVPVGTTNDWIMNCALLGITKIPEEQGEWSAEAALKILSGATPESIPLVKNKKGNLMVNLKMAEKLGVIFAPSVLKNSQIIK